VVVKCEKCGFHDNFVKSLTDDSILCQQCGAEMPKFEKTKVKEGQIRRIVNPLQIGVMQVFKNDQIVEITCISGRFSDFKTDGAVLISESRKDLYKGLGQDITERSNIHLAGGNCVSIETKWFYNNTEVTK